MAHVYIKFHYIFTIVSTPYQVIHLTKPCKFSVCPIHGVPSDKFGGVYRNERSLPIAPVAPCEVVNLGVYTIGIYTPPNFTASQTCAMGEKENILNFTALISLVK